MLTLFLLYKATSWQRAMTALNRDTNNVANKKYNLCHNSISAKILQPKYDPHLECMFVLNHAQNFPESNPSSHIKISPMSTTQPRKLANEKLRL